MPERRLFTNNNSPSTNSAATCPNTTPKTTVLARTSRITLAESWEEDQQKRIGELQNAADNLLPQPTDKAIQFLAGIRHEAVEFGYRNSNGFLWVIYQRLSQECTDPGEWIELLLAAGSPGEFLVHFLDRLTSDDEGRHERTLERLFEFPAYHAVAINRVLHLPAPMPNLLSAALHHLSDPGIVEHLWLGGASISTGVVSKLLQHPQKDVRVAAAFAEWRGDPAFRVRAEIATLWRSAICDADPRQHTLSEIFESDSLLGFEWLQKQLNSETRHLWFVEDEVLYSATQDLSREQRDHLLRLLTPNNYDDGCFNLIMRDHVELFADWLCYHQDDCLRLRPLDRVVGPRWEKMAIIALDAGVSPEELADHCLPHSFGDGGSLSKWYLARVPAYEALASHSDPRLRPAGQNGLHFMRYYAERELERERREEFLFE